MKVDMRDAYGQLEAEIDEFSKRFIANTREKSKENTLQEELLFKVVANGREYRIYANGKVEGFEGEVTIFNYYPQLHFSAQKAIPQDSAQPTAQQQ